MSSGRNASPSFSVVVPTIGRPGYLRGCLAALARCRPPEGGFEVVVVNDGGGEEIERVVAEAPESLDARTAEPSGSGPSAARNSGAAAAGGDYLAFTDDDCEPRADWLRALERALSANPGAGAGGRTVNGATASRGAVATQIVVDALHDAYNRDPAAPRFYASQNIALPAQPFRRMGGFPEGFRYAEDREFCERWLGAGYRFAGAPDAVVDHMRTLGLRELWRQHHGYGRGARAFARSRTASRRGGDTGGVLRAIARRSRRDGDGVATASLIGYLALSQVATTSGYLREAIRPIGQAPRA